MLIHENLGMEVLCAEDVVFVINSILKKELILDQEKEHFWAIGVDVRLRIKFIDLVCIGGLCKAHIHTREVFRHAVHEGCDSLILAHNHPSGCNEPSKDDINLTRTLSDGGHILGINVLDHIIVGNGNFSPYSFNRAKLLPEMSGGISDKLNRIDARINELESKTKSLLRAARAVIKNKKAKDLEEKERAGTD